MASHSAYPHLMHHQHAQHGAHLSPPPLSSIGPPPSQRLPSLRSLNFDYNKPVGEPGTTAIEAASQPQQRGDQVSRTTPFAQQQEYYHQREMSYYQDAASSSAHPGAASLPPKRPRSASNSAQRSPFGLQAHFVHPNSSASGYQPQAHEPPTRGSTNPGTYAQGHPQGNQQGHNQYAPTHHQQPDSANPYYNRLPQSSPAWYYSTAHQPPQQQHQQQQQQQSHQHSPVQQHPHHHQQQQQPPAPQNAAQKHPLQYQQYPAPPASNHQHATHQAPGHAPPPQPPRGSAASYPGAHTQPQPPPQVSADSSPTGSVLAGPGSAPQGGATLTTGFPSPAAPGYPTSGPGLSTGDAGARGADAKALGEDAERAAASGMHLSKITEHSSVLCQFANRYGQLPHIRPSPSEVAEMSQRATLVLQLIEHLRSMASAIQPSPITTFAVPEREREREKESRDDRNAKLGKKRSWEDAGEDTAADRSGEENAMSTSPFEMKDIGAIRSVADQDMAIIRSKRAQGVGAGTSPGAAKAKYRKRSRATPPGKCHSCNIQETPEWRRGPDGARTLCNACGLHYAKLIRKRDKTMGSGQDANAPPIDLEMLRQSTRTAGDGLPLPGGTKSDAYRDDMAEIQLQPVGVSTMQVHQWTPPGVPQRDDGGGGAGGYELNAYSTSLMRSSHARASPA